MTMSPRADGPIAAMAGRSMPGSVLMTILDSASSAPVLPAETTPDASPPATASMARRMEARRTRKAAVGFMSPGILSGVCRTVQAAAARAWRFNRGISFASSPNSRKRAAGWRSAATSIPATTMSGASSPPMPSIASVNGGAGDDIGLDAASLMPRPSAATQPRSGADDALQGLACAHHFAAVVMAAMRADVVRTAQFAAVRAVRMGFDRQRLVAATHAAPRGRGLSLGNSHGTKPLRSTRRSPPRPGRRRHEICSNASRAV